MAPIRAVSVSLGSPGRDYRIDLELPGCELRLERCGCQGDMQLAAKLLADLDGRADTLGLGGANLHYHLGQRQYPCPAALRLKTAVPRTPLLDGAGWKRFVEPLAIDALRDGLGLSLPGRRVLVTSVLDRYWLAAAFHAAGCRVLAGDPFFGLKLPLALPLSLFGLVAPAAMPCLSRLPLSYLYASRRRPPLGQWLASRLVGWAEIIAGDLHFLRRYLPQDLSGKVVVASGITPADRELLRACGLTLLVSTTPVLNGIAPAANAAEAALVAWAGQADPPAYPRLAAALGWLPAVHRLQGALPRPDGCGKIQL